MENASCVGRPAATHAATQALAEPPKPGLPGRSTGFQDPKTKRIVSSDPDGKSLGERIVEALPHLTVVGWKTITEDKAAAAFSRGFYDALARGLTGGGGGLVGEGGSR